MKYIIDKKTSRNIQFLLYIIKLYYSMDIQIKIVYHVSNLLINLKFILSFYLCNCYKILFGNPQLNLMSPKPKCIIFKWIILIILLSR